MALEPVGGGDAADHPFRFVAAQEGFRRNNDGTFLPIVNLTIASTLYDVQFTFTIKKDTYVKGGAPPLEAERTAWVDQICGHAHVQGFYSEQDAGPDGIQYNYGVITVGTDDGAAETFVRQRMDHLNDQKTFQMIDEAWQLLYDAGAR